MRCRNCSTVMMESDPECPSCHASAQSATAPPPGSTGQQSPGLLILLPLFGGLLGGLLMAGIMSAQSPGGSAPAATRTGSGTHSGLRPIFGFLLVLAGGVVLAIAFVSFNDTWEVATREATVMSAAELARADAKSAPAWIRFTFDESKPAGETINRARAGRAGDVQARCMLVRVEDQWMVATVAPGFEGNDLVGRLIPSDSPITKPLHDRVRIHEGRVVALLPFEFNAIEGCASDQNIRYAAGGWLVAFSLVGFLLGLYLLCCRRSPATAEEEKPNRAGRFSRRRNSVGSEFE
jgi:hypothetical protein